MSQNGSFHGTFSFTKSSTNSLYIVLPQTQGSSYLYRTHLQPFFHTHESQIDSTLARVKARFYAFLQQRARMLFNQAAVAMGQAPSDTHASPISRELEEEERLVSAQPPSLNNPMGGPMQLVSSLWGSYGPSIVAGGMALVGAARAAQAQGQTQSGTSKRPGASVLTTPPSSRVRPAAQRNASTEERKRQLEDELRELNNEDEDDVPITVIEGLPGGSGSTSRSSSDSVVHTIRRKGHARNGSGSGGSGRFEEIEVPSDVEGYNVGDNAGKAEGTSTSGAGGGWFSGWSAGTGAGSGKGVKND
ncbi:hypothetical protein AN958_05230 [Leucoagaricus sp. SymC.cos]|nr:hypothetical protein AN958_05230 [Leucoagaricus sp. SymC.cos]